MPCKALLYSMLIIIRYAFPWPASELVENAASVAARLIMCVFREAPAAPSADERTCAIIFYRLLLLLY